MGSGSLGRELDLQSLSISLENHLGEGFTTQFQTLGIMTFRLRDDGPVFTIYRTGSFQIRGPKDEESLQNAEETLRSVLAEIDVEIDEYTFEQRTAVFMDDIDQSIDLEALAVVLGLNNIEYEPEQFPGLVYRPDDSTVTMLIFSSGKVIVSGTTEQSVAEQSIDGLVESLP